MDIYQKFIYLFSFFIMASFLSSNQTRGAELLEPEAYRHFWVRPNQQNVDLLVKSALKTANAKMVLPVSLELKKCRWERDFPVINLSICKGGEEKDEVGYLVCRFGDKGSIDSYPNIDKMFPVVLEGNPTWALLNYIEIYSKLRNQGYSKDALNVFHCFVDTLGSDFTFLECSSYVPHAAHTYKKVGYKFHPTVSEAIKTWGMNRGIESGQEEIEFLKDTRQDVVEEVRPLYMFREKGKIE